MQPLLDAFQRRRLGLIFGALALIFLLMLLVVLALGALPMLRGEPITGTAPTQRRVDWVILSLFIGAPLWAAVWLGLKSLSWLRASISAPVLRTGATLIGLRHRRTYTWVTFRVPAAGDWVARTCDRRGQAGQPGDQVLVEVYTTAPLVTAAYGHYGTREVRALVRKGVGPLRALTGNRGPLT